MAKAVFRHEGAAVDYTPAPGGDVAAGDVVVQGELVGVARLDIKGGTLGALAVEGVFEFPKATGESTAIAAGAVVYWDEGNQRVTTDDAEGANARVGKAALAAGDDDAYVRVRMSQ